MDKRGWTLESLTEVDERRDNRRQRLLATRRYLGDGIASRRNSPEE